MTGDIGIPSLTETEHFFHVLEKMIKKKNSYLCIGIDPHYEDLVKYCKDNISSDLEGFSPNDVAKLCLIQYCVRLIEQTHGYAAIYKPNSAFFERYGSFGIIALKHVVDHIHKRECLVLLDFKRGDIGSTSEAYKCFAYDELRADAITINAYMGNEVVEAFKTKYKVSFVLTKTSNPGSTDFQTIPVQDERPLYLYMAEKLRDESVGYVVGATDLEAIASVAMQEPNSWILAPGVGNQGAKMSDVLHAVHRGVARFNKIIFPISRGITRALDWKQAAKHYAEESAGNRH